MPAGPLGFAAGAQWRREKMDAQTSMAVLSGTELRPSLNIIDGSRTVSALFAEFNVPVVKDLSVNVAGRADHYSDFGNAFSPKAGARYQAAPWLLLRGTVSRAFRAPSLPEITDSTAVSYTGVIDARDPLTPKQSRGVKVMTIANPNLRPERSKNLNLGAVVSPSSSSSSSIGLDDYRIRQDGVIGTASATTIVDNESSAPQQITRGADVTSNWQVTAKANVTFIVQNLANKRAPWDYASTGFDFTQADPRGRVAALKLNYKF